VSAYFGGGIPWVKSGDLNDSVVTSVEETLSQSGLQNSSAKVLPKGTVSIAMYGATIGKTGIFGLDAATNQACANCRVHEGLVDRKFLLYFLQSQKDEFVGAGQGGAQPNISATILKAWPFLLAPLPEQHRIVEKVEALLEQVNRAKARLDRVPLILKRFRQALMLAACSGRLTADWREKHPSPPVGSVCDDIDKGGLPEIPDTWRWARLTDLGELARGKSRHRPRNDPKLFGGCYPFIQTGDVARSRGRITNHSQTYNEAGLAQSRLWPKDTVCITIAANIAESGLLDYPACFPDSVVGLITDRNVCLPEYAEFFIKTARSSLAQFAPATAQANINLEILSKEVSVPLPPTAEQLEIVRTGVSLLHLADSIESRVQAATARANKLPQAILSKAFAGELVPTEAELARLEGRTYETAEELLKRVTALGSDAPSARKGRGRRTG
jgi:type I restriction enzyme S subunit